MHDAAPHLPADSMLCTIADTDSALGQQTDGTLRRRGLFHQNALEPMPKGLSFPQAATLTCSGVTAWNALMGTPGRPVEVGHFVVVQGTGGVSIAALQTSDSGEK